MAEIVPEECTTQGNGIELHYRDWGGQGQAVVLLHGLASHCGIWDLVAPVLAQRNRVVALDLRGHGASGKPVDGYDFDKVASDVDQMCRSLNFLRPVVVGHSWGGNVALQCAVARPDAVSGIVMVDGGFIEPSSRKDWTWERAEEEMAPPLFGEITLDYMRERIRGGNLAAHWSPDVERIILENFYVNQEGYARPHLTRENHMKIVRALWEHQPSKLFPTLECPALLLAARGSVTGNPMEKMREEMVERARGLMPNGEVVWMEDTIHDVPLQRPQKLAEMIAEFASGLAR